MLPSVPTMLKMVVINNTDVRNTFSNVLLEDDRYYLLVIGDGFTQATWGNKFGSRKTVSEADLFYMRDYQGLCRNTGYLLNI